MELAQFPGTSVILTVYNSAEKLARKYHEYFVVLGFFSSFPAVLFLYSQITFSHCCKIKSCMKVQLLARGSGSHDSPVRGTSCYPCAGWRAPFDLNAIERICEQNLSRHLRPTFGRRAATQLVSY